MNKTIKCNNKKIRIYIEDTDYQGFVYHSNYLKYMERARSDFLSDNNINQKNLSKKNLAFVVKSIKIDFILPAELGEELIVKSDVSKVTNARLIFMQQIVNNNNEQCINAEVEVCMINLKLKKPVRLQDDLLSIFI
tara:strand:- start:3511 stop:3918 length:408 start_codon:yes stop_codon:yes gene_type:complete